MFSITELPVLRVSWEWTLLVAVLVCGLVQATQAHAVAITLPAQTAVLTEHTFQFGAEVIFTDLDPSGSVSAPFQLTTPVMIDFSEITLDFDDSLPVVTVAPFVATPTLTDGPVIHLGRGFRSAVTLKEQSWATRS